MQHHASADSRARRLQARARPAPLALRIARARLTQVRGVGRWTVEMMLIFKLGRTDVWPVDDFGIRNGYRIAFDLPALPSSKELLLLGERWRPHRTTAAWYLWRAAEAARKRAENVTNATSRKMPQMKTA
jgi:3-methyladenine DNA glycosylase/8-oxoguanine DNA glycosylase